MAALILALVLGNGVKFEPPIYQRFDVMEVNTFYDDLGREAYTQVLFLNWSPDYRRYHVEAWAIPRNIYEFPVNRGKSWEMNWSDHATSQRRRVVANMYTETQSTIDKERVQKKLYDEKIRDGLRIVPRRKP